MKFRAGQRVVCIDEPPGPIKAPWRGHPRLGEVYTVRGYRPDNEILESILLFEIVNDIGNDRLEAGFWEERFRAVVTPKTDISDLKSLCNQPTPEEIGVARYGKMNWVKS